MALDDPNLKSILDSVIQNYPDDQVPNEIEFALVGYNSDGNLDKNWTVGIDRFGKMLKGLITKYGMDNPDPVIMITINCDKAVNMPSGVGKARARITDDGTGDVTRKFCMTNICNDDHTEYELKNRLNVVDMPEYGVRVRYSTEDPLPAENVQELKNGIQGKSLPKFYRYAQRYTVNLGTIGDNGTTLHIDFTSIKSNSKGAYSFSGAQIIGMCANKSRDRYEIEVELFNKKGVPKEDVIAAREHLGPVLQYLVTMIQGGGVSGEIKNGYDVATSLRNYIILCRRQPWGKRLPNVNVKDLVSQQTLVDAAPYFIGPAIATINRGIIKRKVIQPKTDSNGNIEFTYYFTDKADGERCLMFIDDKGQASIITKSGLMLGDRSEGLTRTINFITTDLTVTMPEKELTFDSESEPDIPQNHKSTVLDGELLLVDGKYYYLSFDVVVYKGKYVDISDFRQRYMLLKSITGSSPTLDLRVKNFKGYTPDAFKAFINSSMFKTVPDEIHGIADINFTDNGITYKLDGIVFQPADEVYPALATNWNSVFKYKPMSMLTVDLHLDYGRKLVKTNSNELEITEGENPDQYAIYTASYNDKGRLGASPHPCYALITNGYPRTTNGDPINKGNIVECRMIVSKGKPYWEPILIRHDKHKPNSVMVHEQVMDQLYEPIYLENFCETDGGFGGKHKITEHNRWVSNRFIIRHARRIKKDNIRLLDLASGNIKSGSAWIAIQKGFNTDSSGTKRVIKVVGIDNCRDNATNIATCYIYMSNLNTGSSGQPLFGCNNYDFYRESMLNPLHTSEDMQLREQTRLPEGFNIVTCIFAIYYTFGSETAFRSFLANISRNLKNGGFFICSYMNGKSVRDLIKKSGGGVAKGGNIWALEQMDEPDDSPFGHKVKVSFDGLYKDNIEYLVDLNHPEVLKIMNQYGLQVYSNEEFTTTNQKINLTKHEQTWAGLHNNICFTKTRVGTELDVYDKMFSDGNGFTPDLTPKLKTTTIAKQPAIKVKTKAKAKTKPRAKQPEAEVKVKVKVKTETKPPVKAKQPEAEVKVKVKTETKRPVKAKLKASIKPKAKPL